MSLKYEPPSETFHISEKKVSVLPRTAVVFVNFSRVCQLKRLHLRVVFVKLISLQTEIQPPMAQDRSTKAISMIKWIRTSRLPETQLPLFSACVSRKVFVVCVCPEPDRGVPRSLKTATLYQSGN